MSRRRDGFVGLSVVPDHVETTGEVSDSRARGCHDAIVAMLREMANRVEGGDMDFQWVERPLTAVLVLLGEEDASVATGGDMARLDVDLSDASQCILAFRHDGGDIVSRQEHVAETRAWRVQERRNAEARQRQHELEYPYLCGCGKRCKTSAGLAGHKTSMGHG